MKVLGLHITGAQTSAALFDEDRIVCGVAEERFDRIKLSRNFPIQSIRFCLDYANLNDLSDLDAVAVAWNPMRHMEKINLSGFTSWRRYDPEWLYITPNNLAQFISKEVDTGASKFSWDSFHDKGIYFVDHHMAHIAQAAFQSPFEECACLIADEYSEYASSTLARVEGTEIKIIKQIPYPHSLGSFYAMITEFLGFRPNIDEWKVMGAAAYGDPSVFYEKLTNLVIWDEANLDLLLELNYFNHYNMKTRTYISDLFEKRVGVSRRMEGDPLTQEHYNLAAAAQNVFEKVIFKMLKSLKEITGLENIALSGGCFMNSLCNGKIRENTAFKNVFIPYATADNGGAIGAALWVTHVKTKTPINRANYIPHTPFIGPSFTDKKIEETLKKYKIKYRQVGDVAKEAAQRIFRGEIVGWFQGRMEFGERALGNRSILADPRDNSMKDKINLAVKYRESFRPFAPSVLEDRAADYFEIPKSVRVPYMEQVYQVRKELGSVIPAVIHKDGTGRLQTVSKQKNSLFHSLISEFENLSGVPVLLNTSFNINGEPIVCSPSDALRTFITSGMDALLMGSFLIEK